MIDHIQAATDEPPAVHIPRLLKSKLSISAPGPLGRKVADGLTLVKDYHFKTPAKALGIALAWGSAWDG